MSNETPIFLGVNIDHVATLRQARGTTYPRPAEAAHLAERSGADSITVHLREDRRHIQDHDLEEVNEVMRTHMNLEMAVTDDMVAIAKRTKPTDVCLVPEKRAELTTEGGQIPADLILFMPGMTGPAWIQGSPLPLSPPVRRS